MRASWVNGLALLNVTLLTLVFLSLNNVSADESVVDEINISISQSCTLIGDFNDPHTAQVSNNTYQAEIGTTTLKAFCNDSGGFAIYAIGFTGDEDGNTDLEGMSDNSHIIATGLATSGETSNWAMKLTATGSSYVPTIENSFNAYHLVPGSWQKVASYSSATDIPTANYTATGSTLTTTYAVFVSPSQTADTYHGRVKYTLVHPVSNVPNQERTCAANKVCYWPNAGDMTAGGVGVVDTMGDQTLAAETTLWPSNFKRAGYGFVGWSDKYDWELNANDASGNGTGANAGYHIYGPNQTLTLNTSDYSSTNGGLSLYAVWAPSAGAIQGWTCPNNTTMPIGTVTALTDTRDSDTYAVAKLADGNCWMIENLRLDYDANITTSNTQSNNGVFGGVFSGLAEPETANFTGTTTSATDPTEPNSLYYAGTGNQGNLGATIDILQQNYAVLRMPRYRNDNTNTNSTINPNTTVANMTRTGQNVYSYGNYYTWAAALANTNYYNDPTATDANNKTSETANTSLCPTGWKLPYGRNSGKGATTGGFSYLDIQLGGTGTDSTSSTTPTGADMSKIYRTYPNNFLSSGYVNGSSVNLRGSYGYYWSSTANTGNTSYRLTLSSTIVYPGTGNNVKYSGNPIRCLVGS